MDFTRNPLSINVLILGELSSLTHAIIDLVKDIDLNARIVRLSPQGQRVVIYRFVFRCNGFAITLHLIECPSAVNWQAQREFLHETKKRLKVDVIIAEIHGDNMQQWIAAMDISALRDCCIICAQRQHGVMPGLMDVFSSLPEIRMIPAVLPGSILDQFEPTSMDQATAMITLFKILIAQSYDSQDTTITQPQRKFVDFHNQLMRSLIDIFQNIMSSISQLAEEVFNIKLKISGLEAQVDEASRHIAVANEELKLLDTEELVPLETMGECYAYHKAKMTKPTPDFTFALRTEFPIRAIVLDVSPNSKWEDSDVESRSIGTFTFYHKLKNSRLKDASAYVRLLGWKRDLNQSAMDSTRAVIEYEDDVRERGLAQILEYEYVIRDLIARSEQHSARLQDYKDDISRLYDVQINGWQLSRMLPTLEVQSLFGVASTLGLRSTIDPKLYPALYQRMRTEGLDGLEELCWSLESKMIDLKEVADISAKAISAAEDKSLLEETTLTLKVKTTTDDASKSNPDALTREYFRDQAVGSVHDEDLVELYTQAHSDFDQMSTSVEAFTDSSHSLLDSIAQQEERGRQGRLAARATTENALNETWKELNAAKATMQLLDSPAIPIGLFTSLRQSNDVVDGCLDAWRCLKETGDDWQQHQSPTRQTADADLDTPIMDQVING